MGAMNFTSKFSPLDTVYMVDSVTITSEIVSSVIIELRPATGNNNPVIAYGLLNSNKKKLEADLYTLDEAKALVTAALISKEIEIANL